MFKRIAIVNRGEAAMRLIHAVRDHNAGTTEAIRTIALYTDDEQSAMFVREADEASPLGPASTRPYLDHELLARVLTEACADAVWVGWGFVAEDAAFVDLVESLGITFIGPSGDAMRKLGDKIGSKLIAEEVGVPVAAWSGGAVDTLDDALSAAARIGYPLMLKASAGGGGRGIRKVHGDDELRDVFQRTKDEAERAFGSGVVFLERLVEGARHIEVQLIADSHGNAWALGVRDCTIQRRNQKIIEESSSPLLTDERVAEVKASAERLALAVGYEGAGTVEFLYQPEEDLFAFLEVNTRLQVEHPITEVTTDFDLVKAQLHVAAGGTLDDRPVESGHAIEVRLNAEDPDRDFTPSPGRISHLKFPAGPGIRVDTGVAQGDEIPSDFDSMIAKIIAHGRDRDEALARLRRALRDTTVVIEGGATNKSFVLELLDRGEVTGEATWADTGWVDRAYGAGQLSADRHADIALVVAAIEAYEEEEDREMERLLETARGGRPQTSHEQESSVDLKLRGQGYQLTCAEIAPGTYRVTLGDEAVIAKRERLDDVQSRVVVDGTRYRVVTALHGPVHLVEVEGVTHRVSRDEGGILRAPAPALVVATPVTVGDEVAAGAPVIVLESMKMETAVVAPYPGIVREIAVRTGTQVPSLAPLVRLEPIGEGTEEAGADRSAVQLGSDAHEPTWHEMRDAIHNEIVGFDGLPGALDSYLAARDQYATDETRNEILTAEMSLLATFSDIAELGRNRPADEQINHELRIHSDREHLHTFLTTLDADRAGLPGTFVQRLERALAHHGVDSLERNRRLEAAVFRIFLAQQRLSHSISLITGILERWLEEPVPANGLAVAAREELERLKRATQLRFGILGDLARSVRFRWFDQPQVDAERAPVLRRMRSLVADLAATDDEQEYADGIAHLASIPEKNDVTLAARLQEGIEGREPMLEVLARKHYGRFGFSPLEIGDRHVVGRFEMDGTPSILISAIVDDPRALEAAGDVHELVQGIEGEGAAIVLDLYSAADDDITLHTPADPLRDQLATWLPTHVTRATMGISIPSGITYITHHWVDDELVEDAIIRGHHPMVARLLHLWRLTEFDLRRLEAPEEVLLVEATAKQNPADRRLIAMTQVRQVGVVRDEEGRLLAVPHGEQAIENGLEAIRRTRSSRGQAGSKLDMNHIWVHVWPTIEIEPVEARLLQHKITPLTDSAGIHEVVVHANFGIDGDEQELAMRFKRGLSGKVQSEAAEPPTGPLPALDDYQSKVLRAHRRGLVYPYELASAISAGGEIVELDLVDGKLEPVERPYGLNSAGIIVAKVTTPTRLHPEGVTRIVLAGDPTKGLGAVAEAECSRIIAALDKAEELQVPVEWFAVSSGARVSMESGTENMDWVGAALKRIVEFTQAGGEINVVVAGINVGAQPYWNAEATMLMHTKGILVMTPDSAMVLTGKQSLDYSGGVSAEDNYGIGGYDRVMGPNGQAQYWAPDLMSAFKVLLQHYDDTYVVPGETGPRRVPTEDPSDRDVSGFPHEWEGSDFQTVGEIFSADKNPDRKKPFDIRTVISAVCDQDHPRTERWAGMADAETAVVMDARLGGHSATVIGIESKPVPRKGFPPTDGPDTYTGGTLFPRSSKKVARAINAASGNRPVVVLANLSGFDGSPESMRKLQLEYGAEIGRAVVNFDGPIVFVVISRYHGGAFVVFSKQLNPNMTVLALEGSYASVLGGAPAAAVVFAGDVAKRTAADPRIVELEESLRQVDAHERAELVAELAELRGGVRSEKISEIAGEFDTKHSIHRAVEVGSVDRVISVPELRSSIIDELDRKSA